MEIRCFTGWKYEDSPIDKTFQNINWEGNKDISAAIIQSRLISVLFKLISNICYKRRRDQLGFLQLRVATAICWSGCLINLTASFSLVFITGLGQFALEVSIVLRPSWVRSSWVLDESVIWYIWRQFCLQERWQKNLKKV